MSSSSSLSVFLFFDFLLAIVNAFVGSLILGENLFSVFFDVDVDCEVFVVGVFGFGVVGGFSFGVGGFCFGVDVAATFFGLAVAGVEGVCADKEAEAGLIA